MHPRLAYFLPPGNQCTQSFRRECGNLWGILNLYDYTNVDIGIGVFNHKMPSLISTLTAHLIEWKIIGRLCNYKLLLVFLQNNRLFGYAVPLIDSLKEVQAYMLPR
jgi:hypothetical protein